MEAWELRFWGFQVQASHRDCNRAPEKLSVKQGPGIKESLWAALTYVFQVFGSTGDRLSKIACWVPVKGT